MGPNRWVVNASPLILLGKTRHLDLRAALAAVVVVPQAVARELSAKPDGPVVLAELAGISGPEFVRKQVQQIEVHGQADLSMFFADGFVPSPRLMMVAALSSALKC